MHIFLGSNNEAEKAPKMRPGIHLETEHMHETRHLLVTSYEWSNAAHRAPLVE
jgi:hypothetical protein